MNPLIMQPNNKAMRMTSREIADLCEKRHDHVCRDIDNLNQTYLSMGFPKVGEGYYTHPNTGNQQHRQFLLTYEQCLDLITGYRADVRIRINRRWQELEGQQLQVPQTLPEALRLAADLAEQNAQQQARLAEVEPKAQALDTITHAKGQMGIRETAKIVGIGQNEFVAWCIDDKKPKTSRFMYRDQSGALYAYQHRISQGFMTQKISSFVGGDGRDRIAPKVRFTPAGIAHIAKLLKKQTQVEGVA
ncbi:phage antirepressor KilAC domain-containing protein [Psychrobacter sp. I-STPA10]|uniref:phage antirepressor KilAC domain-containing protein n=1 Tax=Psychrobacter sp. I-STPA10 TaxID=2585769 RepID=UPI001E365AAB|nr:phage regulatory protein/antirepressor Ant [Psychrobacter sp. I-STPA10]